MTATTSQQHDWREDVGRCVCCWRWCPRCRHCRCQVRTLRLKECVPAAAGVPEGVKA